jgi:hypothetical protein
MDRRERPTTHPVNTMKHLLRPRLSPLACVPSLLLATVLAGVPSASATPINAAPARQEAPLPSGREVIDRYLATAKLTDALDKTSSMHMKGRFKMAAMDLGGPLEILSAKPNLRVTTIDLGPFGKQVMGYDGKVAWSTHEMTGPRILKGAELLQTQLEADYDGAMKKAEHYESLRTVGRETFEGKDCYKVEVVAKPLPGMDAGATKTTRTSYEFYDVATGLQVGTTGVQHSEMGEVPYTAVVSDYKELSGYMLPAKTTMRLASQEFELMIDSVEFDTVKPESFALPPEIRTLAEADAAKPAAAGAPK